MGLEGVEGAVVNPFSCIGPSCMFLHLYGEEVTISLKERIPLLEEILDQGCSEERLGGEPQEGGILRYTQPESDPEGEQRQP